MKTKTKLLYCLLGNIMLFIFLIIIINCFKIHNTYFRFGVPSIKDKPLIVISIKIDNYFKYIGLLIVITIINVSKIIIDSVGTPIIDWNIFNPDKIKIVDFNKNELLIYSNLFYLFSGLRGLFTILISITQFDIALYSVLVEQIASFFIINYLLEEKEFIEYIDLV